MPHWLEGQPDQCVSSADGRAPRVTVNIYIYYGLRLGLIARRKAVSCKEEADRGNEKVSEKVGVEEE
jgi:hypothetical protein